ncbi:hypothetical protein ACTFIU_009609 [Dictyostelium citrinum]
MGNGANHFTEDSSPLPPPPISPPSPTTTSTTTTTTTTTSTSPTNTNINSNIRPIDPETGREVEMESSSPSSPIQSPLPPPIAPPSSYPQSPIPSAPPPSSPPPFQHQTPNTESEIPFVTVPNQYISEEDINNNNGMVSIDFNSSVVQNNQNNFSYPATGNDSISTTISLEKPSDNINYANEELPFRDPSANNNSNFGNNYRNNNNSTSYVYRNTNTNNTTTTTTTSSSNSQYSVRNQGSGLSRRTKFRIISTIISLVICIVVLVIYFGRINN